MTKTKTSASQIEHVPIDDLRPDPANPRKISDAELEALTKSIQQQNIEERLREVHRGLLDYMERFELPEPGEDLLTEVREIMEETVKVTVTVTP